MISYPVDVANTKWSILQQSTGEIVGRNKDWPVADGGEIVGLDPDFVYLLQVNAAQPDYDSRLFFLQGTETVDVGANTITKSWQAIPRPVEERKVAAENEEAAQFEKHFPIERVARETAIMVGLIYHFAIDGQQIPERFRAFADTFKNRVKDKLLPNKDRLDAILADIDAGNEPDLDAGWEE